MEIAQEDAKDSARDISRDSASATQRAREMRQLMAQKEHQAAPEVELPDFATLLAALTRPAAFSYALADADISLRQTHASAVVLTQERAYKLKKPKNFGFFDYS